MKKQIRIILDKLFLILPPIFVVRMHPFSKKSFFFHPWFHRAFLPKQNERDRKMLTFISKNLFSGDTAVDLGAHIGWFTHTMARSVGRNGCVFAVEPGEQNIKLLKINTKKFKNCKIKKCPIASKTAIVNWYEDKKCGFNNSIQKTTPGRKWNENKSIMAPIEKMYKKAHSLDFFLAKNKIKKIKLLKLDCEGEDSNILLNSKKISQLCKIIILEKPLKEKKILDWAKKNHYKLLPRNLGADSGSIIFSK